MVDSAVPPFIAVLTKPVEDGYFMRKAFAADVNPVRLALEDLRERYRHNHNRHNPFIAYLRQLFKEFMAVRYANEMTMYNNTSELTSDEWRKNNTLPTTTGACEMVNRGPQKAEANVGLGIHFDVQMNHECLRAIQRACSSMIGSEGVRIGIIRAMQLCVATLLTSETSDVKIQLDGAIARIGHVQAALVGTPPTDSRSHKLTK